VGQGRLEIPPIADSEHCHQILPQRQKMAVEGSAFLVNRCKFDVSVSAQSNPLSVKENFVQFL
jgi:hypothetical protein